MQTKWPQDEMPTAGRSAPWAVGPHPPPQFEDGMVAVPLEPPQVAATLPITPWSSHPGELSPSALMDQAGGVYQIPGTGADHVLFFFLMYCFTEG